MSPDDRQLLEKTFELSRENNKLLHGIKRAAWWGRVMSLLYWVVIIAASIGLYYYLDPLITSALKMYQALLQNVQKAGDVSESLKGIDTTAVQSAINGILDKIQ